MTGPKGQGDKETGRRSGYHVRPEFSSGIRLPVTFALPPCHPGTLSPQSPGLQQFANRLAIIENVHRPTGAAREGAAWIDANGAIKRGQHLGRRAAAVL